MRRALVVLALALFATTASAQNAPFCAVDATGTRCWYYDMQSCREAVGTRGACVVNQSRDTSSSQPDAWDAFRRGAEAGRDLRNGPAPETPVPATSNLAPIMEQFCRELQRQDIAELDRLIDAGQMDEYERLLPLWWDRSDRCFAIARAAR